jgi:hypothetical protein
MNTGFDISTFLGFLWVLYLILAFACASVLIPIHMEEIQEQRTKRMKFKLALLLPVLLLLTFFWPILLGVAWWKGDAWASR